MHVMVDEPDDDMDVQIATHIVKVHQRRERAFNVPYTMPQVQRYIKYARSIRPQMNMEVRHTTLEMHDFGTYCGSCTKPSHLPKAVALADAHFLVSKKRAVYCKARGHIDNN